MKVKDRKPNKNKGFTTFLLAFIMPWPSRVCLRSRRVAAGETALSSKVLRLVYYSLHIYDGFFLLGQIRCG